MLIKLLFSISMVFIIQASAMAQEEYPRISILLGRFRAEKKFVGTEQVAYWLEKADPVAHQKFVSGQRTVKKGGILAIVGGGVAVVGGAILTMEEIGTLITLGAHETSLTGPVILLAGSAVAFPGIAIMTAGKIKKNRAVKQYNETISQRRTSAYFYQNLSPARIAIGLRF